MGLFPLQSMLESRDSADDVALQNLIPSLKTIGDLDDSAEEVAAEIYYVRGVTGSERVNLVGRSQGGTRTKSYQQVYGAPDAVALSLIHI